jgi:hypothetical protein
VAARMHGAEHELLGKPDDLGFVLYRSCLAR